MTEAPIDLSRPSPPPLIPIRRLMAGGVVPRRSFNKAVSNRAIESKADPSVEVDSAYDFQREDLGPVARQDGQERLRVPILMAVQAERKVLGVCVNYNSIPPSSSFTATEKPIATYLPEVRPAAFSGSTSRLANLGRSHSVPNVAQSANEVCPRRKAVSEERVTEDSEIDNRPTKRRRHEIDQARHECTGTGNDRSRSDANWRNHLCRKSMSGRHIRSGTGAAPATLKGLRDKILSRRLPAAGDVY